MLEAPVVDVRGDRPRLFLYQRQDKPDDSFKDGIHPHRTVNDFQLVALPGGADLLQVMLDASNMSSREPYEWLKDNNWKTDIDLPEEYDTDLIMSHKGSSPQKSRIKLSSGIVSSPDVGKVTLKEQKSSFSHSFIHSSSEVYCEPNGTMVLQLRCPGVKPEAIQSVLSRKIAYDISLTCTSVELPRKFKSNREFEWHIVPTTSSWSLSHATQFFEGGMCINGIGFVALVASGGMESVKLKVNTKQVGTIKAAYLGFAPIGNQICIGGKAEPKESAEVCKFFLTGYTDTPVDESKESSLADDERRLSFWQVKPFPKGASARRFRLFEAHGYEDFRSLNRMSIEYKPMKTVVGPVDGEFVSTRQVHSRFLVFHDLGFGFVNNRDAWKDDLLRMSRVPSVGQRIIGIIGRSIPRLDKGDLYNQIRASRESRCEERGESLETFLLDAFRNPEYVDFNLWDFLYAIFRRQVVTILSAQTLRSHGLRVSRRISWEKTAQDCMSAMRDPSISKLGRFTHTIIRVGLAGAVHFYRGRYSSEVGRKLFFAPIGRGPLGGSKADAFYRDPEVDGEIIGCDQVFITQLVREMISYGQAIYERHSYLEEDLNFDLQNSIAAEVLGTGIKKAILCCQKLFDEGYGNAGSESNSLDFGHDIRTDRADLREKFQALFAEYKAEQTNEIGTAVVELNPNWSLLEESSPMGLYPVACQIVLHGIEAAFRCGPAIKSIPRDKWPPIYAPIVSFGNLLTADRFEIESLRSLDATLRRYEADMTSNRPLSIAVFGPPGSGKSFGVKSIVESIFDKPELITCNVAQLTSPNELATPLLESRESKGIPVVFFDEFDSSLDGNDLGWLRYFLAPMEDGEFRHQTGTRKIGRAILVFAGGTSQSYADFAGIGTANTEEEKLKFARAKGPDFVSRLSGYLDTSGLNQRGSQDNGYIVRRAIQLRAELKRRKLVGPSKTAMVAPQLVEALLQVGHFEHGSRSLRIVLDSCLGHKGATAIPSVSQLNMHINGEKFVADYDKASISPTIKRFTDREGGLYVDTGWWNKPLNLTQKRESI